MRIFLKGNYKIVHFGVVYLGFSIYIKVARERCFGGYQPAQKWIKDRKGRVLGFDVARYCHKIIKALVEIDRSM